MIKTITLITLLVASTVLAGQVVSLSAARTHDAKVKAQELAKYDALAIEYSKTAKYEIDAFEACSFNRVEEYCTKLFKLKRGV